ncbi:MAG: class III signal peptide [Pyrobaculum sp.]
MPTKVKGMISLEIAIIVAIVLVIAVAVGWYLYTTFIASTTAQGRLSISNAEFITSSGTLRLFVTNPGPQAVTIQSVVLNGVSCSSIHPNQLLVGNSTWVTATCGVSATPGSMLPGYVVTTAGSTFPFNAVAR